MKADEERPVLKTEGGRELPNSGIAMYKARIQVVPQPPERSHLEFKTVRVVTDSEPTGLQNDRFVLY